MSLFKCKHPVNSLGVQKEATEVWENVDFTTVTYHLLCMKCGEYVKVEYTKLNGGVDAFLARKRPHASTT